MIYFMQPTDGGRIKIGCSDNVYRRRAELACKAGRKLRVLAVMHGNRVEEQRLHWRFGPLRVEGEWFEPGDDLVGYIATEGIPWAPVKKRPTQSKLELPAEELEEVRAVARSIGLPLATFIRLAVLEKVRKIQEGSK